MLYVWNVEGCTRLEHIKSGDPGVELKIRAAQNTTDDHRQNLYIFEWNDRRNDTETDVVVQR
jgi:hypothetical protein